MQANYLFIGDKGNIGLTWKEASETLGFSFTQCCPVGYEMENVIVEHDISKAFRGKDIILTDSINKDKLEAFQGYQVTLDLLKSANSNALFNPCPPFYRGEEVTAETIDSKYFVGYEFKNSLLEVQQAIIIYHMI